MKNSLLHLIILIFIGCTTQKTVESHQENQQTEISIENQGLGASFAQSEDQLLGKWQLDYISPLSGRDITHFKIQKPYLIFVDDHKVAGNNGCNNIAGEYSVNENEIHFDTDKFASTKMFCQGVDETAFPSALKTINRYSITENGQKLILLTGDIVTMSFVKSEK